MAFTLYDGTIGVVQSLLLTLSHILNQAEQHGDKNALLEARLHENMYPLPDQIRLATQYSENIAARLVGRDPVTFERDLTSFNKFYERIETVLKTLKETDKDVVNRDGDVVKPTQLGPDRMVDMSNASYVHKIALPNIYFHLTTAYGILRKEGVPLGKLDYYNGFIPR